MCIVWVREKNNSFEIHVIILRYIKNVTLPFKKCFKFAELLTKTSFFLETIPKMAKERNKGDVESVCVKVTKQSSKKAAKAEVNLNY